MGNPGAIFHFCRGAVIAVTSPGAPGADTVLIRSGRITVDDWEAALCADARTGHDQPAIVTQGSIDEADLHEALLAAMWDATFAAAVGEIDDCLVEGESSEFVTLVLPPDLGVSPHRVLAETIDRLDSFAALPVLVSPYRDRVIPVGDQEPDTPDALRQEILKQANGRRTARDIAFATGRGLHAITAEVSRMLSGGLLEIGPPTPVIIPPHADFVSLDRRSRPDHDGDQEGPLPVRNPGQSTNSS